MQGGPIAAAQKHLIHACTAGRWAQPANRRCLCQPSSLYPSDHTYRPTPTHRPPQLCHATEHARIAFGKSGIHGWGLFARAPMKQDSLVTEYRCVAFLSRCCIVCGGLHGRL